jgi:ribonuclease BN (tRNA processing enzyme)
VKQDHSRLPRRRSRCQRPGHDALRVTCWGTRGSIPSPGPATARFGGNTSCLEIRTADDRCHIFDAGTGLRVLGNRLAQEHGATDVDLFVTHFHWDHIQGIPFFEPLHSEDTFLRIHGARQGDEDIETLLRGRWGRSTSPSPTRRWRPTSPSSTSGVEPWRDNGTEVAATRSATRPYLRLPHPSAHCGGGLHPGQRAGGRTLRRGRPGWYPGLVDFLQGVDTFFHDAMFTDEEYPAVEGWGHSTFNRPRSSRKTRARKRLFFFHHAPERTDAELLRILEQARADLERRGSDLELGVAAEGEELLVQGGHP